MREERAKNLGDVGVPEEGWWWSWWNLKELRSKG